MKIILENNPSLKDKSFLFDQLQKYNAKFSSPDNNKALSVFLKNDLGEIKGGIAGTTYWEWLNIDTFWIDEEYRKQGFGKQLLQAAEKEDIKRGCNNVHLDTHDFQAVEFYKNNAYEIAGQLDDLPKGHTRYLLRKELN